MARVQAVVPVKQPFCYCPAAGLDCAGGQAADTGWGPRHCEKGLQSPRGRARAAARKEGKFTASSTTREFSLAIGEWQAGFRLPACMTAPNATMPPQASINAISSMAETLSTQAVSLSRSPPLFLPPLPLSPSPSPLPFHYPSPSPSLLLLPVWLWGLCLLASWQTQLQREMLGFQKEMFSSQASVVPQPGLRKCRKLRAPNTRQETWQNSVTWSRRW